MPIYDFRCRECGRVLKIFLRDTNQMARCSGCGSDNMERLFSTSYMIKMNASAPGTTCCGRTERCETPPALQRAYAAESKGIYMQILAQEVYK